MQIIDTVMREFISQHRMFTSVDVANDIKQRGTWVRNRDVAEYLRQHVAVDSGWAYSVHLIDVTLADGSTVAANLYHHASTDPTAYRNTNQRAISRPEFDALQAVRAAAQPATPAPVSPAKPATVLPPVTITTPAPAAPPVTDQATQAAAIGQAVTAFFRGFKWPKLGH